MTELLYRDTSGSGALLPDLTLSPAGSKLAPELLRTESYGDVLGGFKNIK